MDETVDDVEGTLSRTLLGQTGRSRALELVYAGPDASPERLRRFDLDGRTLLIGRQPGLGHAAIADARASREHAALELEDGYRLRDLDSRNGTYLNGVKLEAPRRLNHGDIIRVGECIFVYLDLTVPQGVRVVDRPQGLSLARAIADAGASLAAPTELPVLILGPTGAGKEVLAQQIHAQSGRKGPIVAVNCATLSKELLASELFGHTAGAFSGAKGSRPGLFVSAQGGTLFLDEVAELPLDQQPALLRALQEKRVRPVGADHEVSVDVRIIAATLQPLEARVEAGTFRADLYARLAGFVVELSGLEQRKEEVLPLFAKFLEDDKKPLSREAAERLLLHDWPQNVRELQHAAARARLYSRGAAQIELSALPPSIANPEPKPKPSSAPQIPAVSTLAVDDEPPSPETLAKLLAEAGGNVAQVARNLGKHRQQVYRWIKRFNLDLGAHRPED